MPRVSAESEFGGGPESEFGGKAESEFGGKAESEFGGKAESEFGGKAESEFGGGSLSVSLSGISKVYPDGTEALANIDLRLEVGVYGLLGPNGAGKTTLLSILTLAQQPTKGERRYFGLDDRASHYPAIRRRLGYLPQEFFPVAELSGLEYLLACGELRQVPLTRHELERRALRLLDAVELVAAAHLPAGHYSGGMKRRLGLAQALLHAPSCLVVDEPTAGLDPEERVRFRHLITELGDEIPVLLSTHIVEDVEATCPRIGILSRGRLQLEAPPRELLQRAAGRLWLETQRSRVAVGRRVVGQRTGDGGVAAQVVLSDEPSDTELVAVEPTLEEAYAVVLADLEPQTTQGATAR